MAKAKFKWKKSGYEALQRSSAGFHAVTHYASQVGVRANALCAEEGGVYETRVLQGTKGRRVAHGVVKTGNVEAMVDNADNNTLAKALGGA